MEKKFDTFFYGADNDAYMSYDVPKDLISKRFDFSKTSDQNKLRNSLSIKYIYGVIEAIHDNYVVMNCLVNKAEGITQRRKFDIEPLRDVIEFFEGEGVEITIRTFAGKREFIYSPCPEAKELFEEPEDIFSKHKGSSFFYSKHDD